MTEIPHFYIYDHSNNGHDLDTYTYGDMAIANKSLVKNNHWKDENRLFEAIENAAGKLNPQKNGMLIYIHGYQADNIYFMQKSGYVLQRSIFSAPTHPYGLTLSVQWSSVIPYTKAVTSAYEKGQQFVAILCKIKDLIHLHHPDAPISFICHSMGNRVFEGLYQGWIQHDPKLSLQNVFFMAADLESDIFARSFQDIAHRVNHLSVYYHHEDVTLRIANAMVRHPRLGIFGTMDHFCPPNCIQRDVTSVEDDKSFAGTLTNHRYFYGSQTIRTEIINQLAII